jgi:D-alanyl-D-alanine carboxypeptidase
MHTLAVATILIAFVLFMFIDQAVSRPAAIRTNTSIKDTFSLRFSYRNNQNKLTMQEYINIDNDSSLYKYVNSNVPLHDKKYVPAMLVPVSSEYVIQRSKWMELRPEANAALHDLAKAFYDAFDKNLYLVSAYRSSALQQSLIDEWCGAHRCAKPGTSEHQLGLAIDIHVWINGRQSNSMSNKGSVYYRRLEQNAHKFGWHNTFQKWVHIDGQMEEWRHWRYIGKSFATQLWEQDITLAEYYNTIKK